MSVGVVGWNVTVVVVSEVVEEGASAFSSELSEEHAEAINPPTTSTGRSHREARARRRAPHGLVPCPSCRRRLPR